MIWLKIIFGWLTGNLGTIATAIVGVIGKLSDNQTAQITATLGSEQAVQVAQIQAAATAWHDRASLFAGMRITQWLLAAAYIPPILHQGLVFLDSSCWGKSVDGIAHGCGLGVPSLPAPYAEREWLIIASLLGIQTGVVAAGSFLRWLHK